MDKLKMQTENIVDENIDFIGKKFPNCIVEAKDESGKLTKMVDFDLLKQELSKVVVDGDKERYTMNWPDKKQAILTANAPISKTLRPCKEKSVDFDNTKNIYIEGDNLDVLKVLRETYLGKIKMIYIDPPYNTGNDFVYNDDFATDTTDYLERSNQIDEDGNRMTVNSDSNGRFHTDWLNMMYPRLKIAKDLLAEDGSIFISIDDREQENLKKICNEIFGEANCVGVGQWRRVEGKPGKAVTMARTSEFVLIYAKNFSQFTIGTLPLSEDGLKEFRYSDEKGKFRRGQIYYPNRGIHHYSVVSPYGNTIEGDFTIKQSVFEEYLSKDLIYWAEQGDHTPYLKIYLSEFEGVTPTNTFGKEYGSSQSAVKEFKELFNTEKMYFDNPKPLKLINRLLLIGNLKDDSIVLDFFSGSATTAHAVMNINLQENKNIKYIMVQLPEVCDEKSEAKKAGYETICDIGQDRIKKAGHKLKEKQIQTINNLSFLPDDDIESEKQERKQYCDKLDKLDVGFRVFKLDSSNMKETYYKPADYSLNLLDQLDENIKPDRTPEDLLFQVMLDLGLMLDSKIEEKNINGKKVFVVGEYNDYVSPDLICCFDSNVDNNTVTEIAKMKPRFSVFRDSSMSRDSVAVNFDQIFETYSPSTTRKVL